MSSKISDLAHCVPPTYPKVKEWSTKVEWKIGRIAVKSEIIASFKINNDTSTFRKVLPYITQQLSLSNTGGNLEPTVLSK